MSFVLMYNMYRTYSAGNNVRVNNILWREWSIFLDERGRKKYNCPADPKGIGNIFYTFRLLYPIIGFRLPR